MKQLTLLLSFTFFLLGAKAQNQATINKHMMTMNLLLSNYAGTFDASLVKEINSIKWNASDFDESFIVFFNRFQPHSDDNADAFKKELINWTLAVNKDLKGVTETDIRTYISKIKKMQNANLTMWYFVNVYANMFYSQRSMQDKRPMEE